MSRGNGGGETTRPSLFDIALYAFSFVCPIFFLKNWDLNMAQGIFFVFGVFSLLGISFFCKKKREYTNKWLGAVILWSLLSVFLHSFDFSLNKSYAASFINFCLLSEGFIYVLCGVVLFYLVVSYQNKFNIFYPILAINILNLIFVITQKMGINLIWNNIPLPCGVMGTIYQLKVFSAFSIPILWHYRWNNKDRAWLPFVLIPIIVLALIFKTAGGYSFNSIIAFGLALLIYLYKTRQLERFYILLSSSVVSFLFFRGDIMGKFWQRISLDVILLKGIIKSSVFGLGFDNSITGNTILTKNGWMLPQNDCLNIARDLGIPFLFFILLIVWKTLKNTKVDYLWLAIMVLAIDCCMQTSMYYPRIALWGIIMPALKGCEKNETRHLPEVSE